MHLIRTFSNDFAHSKLSLALNTEPATSDTQVTALPLLLGCPKGRIKAWMFGFLPEERFVPLILDAFAMRF
jgi:hypothetical protein